MLPRFSQGEVKTTSVQIVWHRKWVKRALLSATASAGTLWRTHKENENVCARFSIVLE
jgi:hypothetical protein